MPTVIYGLFSTRDNVVRYIGKSTSLKSRLQGHLQSEADDPKDKWIKKELAEGFKIEAVTLLENASGSFDEQRMLDVYGAARGHVKQQLFNQLGLETTVPPKQTGNSYGQQQSERDVIKQISAAKNVSLREATRLRNAQKN